MNGVDTQRQPVHTLYGGAQLFKPGALDKLRGIALRSFQEFGGAAEEFGGLFDLPPVLAATVHARVEQKLRAEAIEDYRVDFEDGYGYRAPEEEDRHAIEAAGAVGQNALPPFFGIRVKPLAPAARARSLRTLDLFLANLSRVPEGFAVTLPKVSCEEEVRTLCAALNPAIRVEIMIETPQAVLNARKIVDAADGRCRGAHFGPYDFTASLGIVAAQQSLDHPACDFARTQLQISLADSGVFISDGPTSILPVSNSRDAVQGAWRLHFDNVTRALQRGLYQGWDLHPAQLPARYAAVYAFYFQALSPAAARLRNFLDRAAQATRAGQVFDDAATVRGLMNFFDRGLSCGAIRPEDLTDSQIRPEDLARRF